MRYQVMPELTPIEYEALKADIAERGVLVPVEIDELGDILDGHHRVRAWRELFDEGINLPDYPCIVRHGLSEEQKRNHARSLNVLRRQLSPEQRMEVMIAMRQDGMSYRSIAKAVGVDAATVHRQVSGVASATPDFVSGADGKQYPAQTSRYVPPDHMSFEDQWGSVETIPKSLPHVANNSGNNEWYTPAEYIEAARRVMSVIDLDPASSVQANEVVGATFYYTSDDDGLSKRWSGRVWMNPPYASDLVGRFAERLVQYYQGAFVTEAIVLVNNATETAWFQTMAAAASAICFPRGRVRFWNPAGTVGAPLQGQAILYLGTQVQSFKKEFAEFGFVVEVA